MHTDIVLAMTGPDRIGIVEEVTGILLDLGGNVKLSRMARLGGEFAILALVSLPGDHAESLTPAFSDLAAQGYKFNASRVIPEAGEHEGWLPYHVTVRGADHEGIIHDIARGLAERGINIESIETSTTEAPITGSPLFEMTALVAVPPELDETDWIWTLAESGGHANVDVEVAPAE